MSFLSDIHQQPDVLRSLVSTYQAHSPWSQLAGLVHQPPRQILLTGMGASYNALFPIALYLNQQGIPTIQIEASELVHYASTLVQQAALMVVVSQSGESVEIRRLVEVSQGKVAIASITNHQDNFLAQHSQIALTTQAGAEVGVATKTYTSCLGLLHILGRQLTQQYQPGDEQALLNVADLMASLLVKLDGAIAAALEHLYSCQFLTLLGRGPAVASAMNGALMLKEAARIPAEGLSGGQFRHGPMEAVSPNAGIIMFANGGRTQALMQKLAVDISDRGGRVVVIGQGIDHKTICNIPLPIVDEYLSPLPEIIPIQLLTAGFAKHRGIIPGEFRWGAKVVQAE
jgi:glutamine---fructose-6-phosphate transaminase (isomerizing)